MKRTVPGSLAALLLGLAAGCAPVEPSEVVYGAPQRVGVAATTYVPVVSESDVWTDTLGFDSSSGVEVSYALPLKPGFDLKIAVDFGIWPVKLHPTPLPPVGATEKATWDQTGITFLLRGGWKWGRLGAHYAAGLGWLVNDLEWEGRTAEADGSLAVQSDIGVTFTLHPKADLGLDLSYRASRGVYERDGVSHDQILEAMMVKIGLAFMF